MCILDYCSLIIIFLQQKKQHIPETNIYNVFQTEIKFVQLYKNEKRNM